MKVELKHEQKIVLGQQMQMSMQMLQMDHQELETYLQELALENPMLDIQPPEEVHSHPLSTLSSGYSFKSQERSDGVEYIKPVSLYPSLKGSLQEQIAAARVPELMRRELLYLVDELDERGYLPEDPGDLQIFGGSLLQYENAVTVLQSLEPVGIGARNLSECLCLQLRRMGVEDALPYQVCQEYLEPLAKGQFNAIAKKLGVSKYRVTQAKGLISTLNPHPSNGFDSSNVVPHIIPDVEIIQEQDRLIVRPADRYMSSYGVDDFYAKMAQQPNLTPEEQEYFRSKLSQAKWAIQCVARRRETLSACAQLILEQQYEFFLGNTDQLLPVTMTDLSRQLGISVSTVSRAVKGKYLSCKRGTFPLSYFFQKEINGPESGTGKDVLAGIRELIAQEDPSNPFSDRELAERLEEQGIKVSRRTVAKYRESAAIPSAPGRKVWQHKD